MNDNMNNIPAENNEEYIVKPAENAKRKPKKGLIIGLVAAVLALVVALVLIIFGAKGAFGPSDSSDGSKDSDSSEVSKGSGLEKLEEKEYEPLELVGVGFANSIVAYSKSSDIAMAADVLSGGSTELSMDFGTFMEMTTGYALGDGEISVKLYTDAEAQQSALVAQVEGQGEKVDAGIYFSENAFAIESEAMLGKDAYGINLDDMLENFPTSEFGPNGAYSLGIDLSEMGQMDPEQMEKLGSSAVTMALGFGKQAMESLEENSDISKEDDTLSIGGEDVDVTAVVIEMDGEQVVAFADEMLQYFSEDEDFRAFLEDYLGIMAESSGMSSSEVEEVIDSFYEELEVAQEDLKDPEVLEGAEEASLELVFYITESDKQLVGMDLAVEDEYTDEKISVVIGPDWEELSEFSICVNSDGYETCFEYIVEQNDKKEFLAKFEATEDDEVIVEGELQWDKENGDFKLEANDGYDFIYAIGTMTKSDEEFEIFLQKVGVEDEEEIEINLTITFSTSDTMPEMPKYKDILTMSEEELAPLMELFGLAGAAPVAEPETEYTYYN